MHASYFITKNLCLKMSEKLFLPVIIKIIVSYLYHKLNGYMRLKNEQNASTNKTLNFPIQNQLIQITWNLFLLCFFHITIYLFSSKTLGCHMSLQSSL